MICTTQAPFVIGSRLLPCLSIGDATLHLEGLFEADEGNGMQAAHFILEVPGFKPYEDRRLLSGACGFWSPVEAFETFLDFLEYGDDGGGCEAEDMPAFPADVADWAGKNACLIEAVRLDLSDEFGVRHGLILEGC